MAIMAFEHREGYSAEGVVGRWLISLQVAALLEQGDAPLRCFFGGHAGNVGDPDYRFHLHTTDAGSKKERMVVFSGDFRHMPVKM